MNEAGLDQEELPQPAPAQRFGFALLSNSPSSEVFLPQQSTVERAAQLLSFSLLSPPKYLCV